VSISNIAARGERGVETLVEAWGVSRGGDGEDEVDEDDEVDEVDIEVGQEREVYILCRQTRNDATSSGWVKAGPCRGQWVQGATRGVLVLLLVLYTAQDKKRRD
jgi:hypothetical protein